MGCNYPLRGYKLGVNPATGKELIKVLPHGSFQFVNGNRIVSLTDDNAYFIPCGKCIGCRMSYAREWANRLMLESQAHQNSCFVTLTFDDEHIVDQCGRAQTDANGEVTHVSLSINKRHIQLFMKSLRKRVEPARLRFYACGEYGGETGRPHYHLIIFGFNFPEGDLRWLKKSELKYDYYCSKMISEIWPYGNNIVAQCTWESCCYVTRYMLKKLKGPGAKIYEENDIEPPFVLMSRKPGIGTCAYDPKSFNDRHSFIVSNQDGYKEFPPPKFLESLFERDFPDESLIRKERRREAANATKNLISKGTSLPYLDYLDLQE